MTLDEAIRHCEEVADRLRQGCDDVAMSCEADHRQLAKWLRELKELRSNAQGHENDHIAEVSKKDTISRQAAIDALCDNCDHAQAVCPHYPCKQYTAIDALPNLQQTCNYVATDCISREAAISQIQDLISAWNDWITDSVKERKGLDATLCVLEDMPAIQPKRGRWELDDDPHDGDCRCSYCGTAIEAMHERHHGLLNTLTGGKWWTFYKYCPNCGAQMGKGEDDEVN